MAYFGGLATNRSRFRFDATGTILLMVAVTCLLSIIVLYREKGKEVPVEAENAMQMPLVLVARDVIWPGQELNEDLFTVEGRPVEGFEEQVVLKRKDMLGGYANSVIPANSPLLKEQVTFTAPTNVITAQIPAGFRAVTISVTAESGVEGWVRPGARIDVVWSTVHRDKRLVSTIVENAQVLSAQQSPETANNRKTRSAAGPTPSTVTLLVNKADAQKIQLAKSSGFMSLNLRGDEDDAQSGSETITMDSLIKRSQLMGEGEVEGTIFVDGKEFVIRGGRLVEMSEVSEEDLAVARRTRIH